MDNIRWAWGHHTDGMHWSTTLRTGRRLGGGHVEVAAMPAATLFALPAQEACSTGFTATATL